MLLNGFFGRPVTAVGLNRIFSYKSLSLNEPGSGTTIAACLFNALFGGCFLMFVVERAKKCFDFAFTAHFLHLYGCYLYDGFPDTWEWWIVNIVSLVAMSLLGEYLCQRREMQEIQLLPSR